MGPFQACAVLENQCSPALPRLCIEKDPPAWGCTNVVYRKAASSLAMSSVTLKGHQLKTVLLDRSSCLGQWWRGPCLYCPHMFWLFPGMVSMETSSLTPCQACGIFLFLEGRFLFFSVFFEICFIYFNSESVDNKNLIPISLFDWLGTPCYQTYVFTWIKMK